MLMPLPATLRLLVKDYETLLAEETLAGAPAPSPRLRDLAYTLCVSTGTRDTADALRTAHAYLDTHSGRVAAPALAGRSGTAVV
ncbi:DUF5133 domain-containing protein [Streptomyces sp. J2-1]|uniref:DUF5133 domain-containing protein n=1 Tax=Streptomyces corallincola TaxID=2851888 RepID=UPI001C38CCCE|nr:DUF5133 domain-containing protein [Streptomyces corallincola]MBV2355564.1 DUF5133 domain-containing protein [Streptomyces corallincola]